MKRTKNQDHKIAQLQSSSRYPQFMVVPFASYVSVKFDWWHSVQNQQFLERRESEADTQQNSCFSWSQM